MRRMRGEHEAGCSKDNYCIALPDGQHGRKDRLARTKDAFEQPLTYKAERHVLGLANLKRSLRAAEALGEKKECAGGGLRKRWKTDNTFQIRFSYHCVGASETRKLEKEGKALEDTRAVSRKEDPMNSIAGSLRGWWLNCAARTARGNRLWSKNAES